MKQIIVLMATITLGLFIYQCIAGPGDSLQSSLGAAWRYELSNHPYAGATL